ncbi:MAG: rhomboid family intramembrane serine protease [Haloarculaceae archaeon]
MVDAVPAWAWRAGVLLAALVGAVVLVRLARPGGRWGRALRRRFVLGVPWGTLVVVGFVLGVYLFLQGGFESWYRPVVIPFRAWSYFYPLGILASGFAHTGTNHLIGNLLGTLAFGTLAEYAWGHFPTERGTATFSSLRTDPFARIGAFVLGSLVVGVFTAAFSLGPVIGFSGVVFAFAGFALVRYPLGTLVVVLAGGFVDLAYRALQSPTLVAEARPRFSTPWWADVAIQGHAVGLFVGVVLATLLIRRRGVRPSPAHLFVAALLFAVDRGLWAVYTFLGGSRFELFRAGGLALVLLLAALVAAAPTASARTLVGRIDLRSHEAAVGLALAVLIALSTAAVPYNLVAPTSGGDALDDATGVEVRDYTVYYAEGVTDRLVSVVDVPGINTSVRTSGVIVVSEARSIWWTAFSRSEIAFAGERRVRLGGVGWQESVVVDRTGWSVVGGPATYKVSLRRAGGDEPPRLAWTADPSTAEPTVEGRNVTVEPVEDGFDLRVTRNHTTLGRAPIPAVNGTAEAGGLTFTNREGKLFAVADGTRVRVAKRETYGPEAQER